MIEIPRGLTRSFRAVTRKCSTGRPKGPSPPVLVRARRGRLTLTRWCADACISVDVPLPDPTSECLVVPGDAFDAFDTAGPVELHVAVQTAFARLATPNGPRDVPFPLRPVDSVAEPRPIRRNWLFAMDTPLRQALHECGRCVSRDVGGRYAIHRLQLQGRAGRVVGTDGQHILFWNGFTFPFDENLLVPALPVFGPRGLTDSEDLRIGRVESDLVVAVGPWTVRLPIETSGRFPDVESVIPRNRGGTILELADDDADRLLARFERPAPEAEDDDAVNAVVLELGPRSLARPPAPLVGDAVPLAASSVTGPPVTVSLNRVHFVRALALGLRRVQVAAPDKPVALRDHDRLMVTMPMHPEPVRSPAPESEPSPADAESTEACPEPETSSTSELSPRIVAMKPEANGHTNGRFDPPPAETLDPLAEAEALRAALLDAAQKAGRLIQALKSGRKQKRALESAWTALRSLQLGPSGVTP